MDKSFRLGKYSFISDKIVPNRVVNGIAWISVSLSVAIMIVAISVVDGFRREISAKATGFMGAVVLTVPGQSPVNDLCPESGNISYRDDILALECVESVDGVVYKSGMIKSDDEIYGLYFKGVDSTYNFSFFENCLYDGQVPDFKGRISDEIMISKRTAEAMKYKVGDDVVAYFVEQDVKVRKFKVAAIFDAQLEDIDKTMAIIDIRQARRLYGWDKDAVSSIEVRLAENADIDYSYLQVSDLVSEKMTDDDPSYFVMNIRQIFGNLFDWLALLDLNVLMILVLMMIVAGFNMISAVLIILFEKISMIGLLKALGMNNKDVCKVFMLKSFKIVGKGIVLGDIVGIAVCAIQYFTHFIKLNPENYFVKFVPIDFNFLKIAALDVISAAVIMAIISVSALFISKISPARTMRVE